MPRGNDQDFDEDDELEQEETDKDWDADGDIDGDVQDLFAEAQDLAYGRGDLIRRLESHTEKSPSLSGGDIDASWDQADVGEETVGGENPTPDQSVVEDQGQAVGLTYQDNEDLDSQGKLEKRDRDPWELNPRSDPEFSTRTEEEFEEPLDQMTGAELAKRANEPAALRGSGKETAGQSTNKPAPRKKPAATGARGGHEAGGTRNLSTGLRTLQTNRKTTSPRRTKTGRRAAGK